MSATDDYKILLNILSKTGVNGDLMGEFAKAKSMIHGFQSYQATQPPPPVPTADPNLPPTDSSQPSGDTNSPQIGDNATQQSTGAKYDNI
jgi:hypothetical protein